MRIEFVTDYQSHPAGQILDLAGGVADVLVRRGIARPAPVAEAGAAGESNLSAAEPPAEVPAAPVAETTPEPDPKPKKPVVPKPKKGK